MFILRRITKTGLEINTSLDIEYVLVLKETNPKEFKKTLENWNKDDLEDVYGFVSFDDGASIMPLYKSSKYYIMASDGKTFANITYK